VAFADGRHQLAILRVEQRPWIGAMKMKSAIIQEFVPEFFESERPGMISVRPKDGDHLSKYR
jgi:hypothetical protein